MQNYHLYRLLVSFSSVLIICGSAGMILFASRFPFSTSIKELKFSDERWYGLNGYEVWVWSWCLIIIGTVIQLLSYWIPEEGVQITV
jgi:hypothetical protein